MYEGDDDIGSKLESELLKSLGETFPQSRNSSFVLAVNDSSSKLVGGVTASTSYRWFLVKILWIGKECRGEGLGRSLMRQAETKGKELECHYIWLVTSNPVRTVPVRFAVKTCGLVR